MTKQEKFNRILDEIEKLGEDLHDLCVNDEGEYLNDDIENSMFSLRLTVDELRDQEIE